MTRIYHNHSTPNNTYYAYETRTLPHQYYHTHARHHPNKTHRIPTLDDTIHHNHRKHLKTPENT